MLRNTLFECLFTAFLFSGNHQSGITSSFHSLIILKQQTHHVRNHSWTDLRGNPYLVPRLRGGKSGINIGEISAKYDRIRDMDYEQPLMYKPGASGFGKVVVGDEDPFMSYGNSTPLFEINLTELTEQGNLPEPINYTCGEWWRNATRDEIMDYIRTIDPVQTPDANLDNERNSELAWASGRGEADRLEGLVAQGASVNAGGAGGSSQWTALHHAARENHTAAVVRLLQLGARANVGTWGRWTALHFCCAKGNTEMAEALLRHGGDMYALNSDGNNPRDLLLEDDDETRELFDRFGFSLRAALDRKAAASFVIPQFPRRRNGTLDNVVEMSGPARDPLPLGRAETMRMGSPGPDGLGQIEVTKFHNDALPTTPWGIPEDLVPDSQPSSWEIDSETLGRKQRPGQGPSSHSDMDQA